MSITKIVILDGPNLNKIGTREPDIYGDISIKDYLLELQKSYSDLCLEHYQSNYEGQLIDWLQQFATEPSVLGFVLNAGAYTHSSIAIADAIRSIDKPVIEVHISNIYARETFRQQSFISPVATGSISGLGLLSYHLAIEALKRKKSDCLV